MNKLSIFIAIMICALVSQGQLNQNVLKGQITQSKGIPIANVSVINLKDTTERAITDANGLFTLFSKDLIMKVSSWKSGFHVQLSEVSSSRFIAIELKPILIEVDVLAESEMDVMSLSEDIPASTGASKRMSYSFAPSHPSELMYNTESYSPINENDFHATVDEPLSTFSIDVDRASYSNVRRFVNGGALPPIDAVRVDEMINYFDYDYESPSGDDPVEIFSEVSIAPWNSEHYVMHIGLKAKELDKHQLPASNLVFLLDVSGSMNAATKLPLLKSAMKMLVGELRDDDRVAIVVYAGAAGLVLESTPGYEKDKIYRAIDNLNAGGSTAGGAGIKLAYSVAAQNLIEKGNNRVILATDGDFNIGASGDGEMQRLIEEKRELGVFLTVLGFGTGNYKDSKMETLADKGNGNYAYIDNLTEAKKTLVNEFGATLFTVAKDVKLQVEFNPQNAAEYRLIGYENRLLNKEDFNDDTKDAGEMGAGHVVTALYEIVPKGNNGNSKVYPLKYGLGPKLSKPPFKEQFTNELATVKMRYKSTERGASELLAQTVQNDIRSAEMTSNNLKWSMAVAGFGMLLRHSKYARGLDYRSVIESAENSLGEDREGYRRECLQLMKLAEILDKSTALK